ncbi:MAG TPA: hypothetical protein VNM87_09280, partial [Candidatus Udaeobacter sp.]|nr:hypothetical protein [Candidatus Udaeobacter sp.]
MSWWRAFWITNVILLVITWYAVGVWPKSELLRVLHLGIETNPATWWSATQLFLAALLLRSVATSIVERDRAAARACTILALVSLALYADELGSLHERLGMFFALKHYREAPFALPIGGAVAYSLLVLERRRFLVGSTARLVAAGFACFVLAGAQELLENRFVAERWMDAFRTVIEEGSELAGTFLFLVAGIRARRTASEEPLGSIADWRSLGWVVLLALLCTAPVLFFRSQWTFDQLRIPKLGDFGVVIPVAAFSCAAGAAALQARSKRQP